MFLISKLTKYLQYVAYINSQVAGFLLGPSFQRSEAINAVSVFQETKRTVYFSNPFLHVVKIPFFFTLAYFLEAQQHLPAKPDVAFQPKKCTGCTFQVCQWLCMRLECQSRSGGLGRLCSCYSKQKEPRKRLWNFTVSATFSSQI